MQACCLSICDFLNTHTASDQSVSYRCAVGELALRQATDARARKNCFLYGTKTSIPLLFLTKEIGQREYSMKLTVATFSAILFVSGFSPLAHAQAQIAVPGVGEVTTGQPPPPPPPPGYGRAPQSEYAEHCDHLRHREHELRERVAYLPYGPERARLEHQLQEVQDERDQCWRR